MLFALLTPLFAENRSALNPLENFEVFTAERGFIREAEAAADEGDYVEAAALYRKACKLQNSAAKQAGYTLQEAQMLLLSKKRSNRAREVYVTLLEKYLFHIPLESVIEQMRELAGDYEQGIGTFLGIKDSMASIEIYKLIVKYQPAIEQSLEDRLILARKQEAAKLYQDAVDTYQALVKLAPENPDTRLGLALLLEKLAKDNDGDGQRTAASIREANRFLELSSPSDPRRPAAEAVITNGKNAQAAQLVELAKFYLIKYHYRPEVARRYLHDVQREYPDTPAAREAKEILLRNFKDE